MRLAFVHHAVFNEIGGHQAARSHKELHRPQQHGSAACPLTEVASGFQSDIKCAVRTQRNQCNYSRQHRVPIKNSGVGAYVEIGPERLEKVTVWTYRHAAHHIAERRSEENSKQNTRPAEHHIEEALPHRLIDVAAEFDSNCAQDQQPQDHHERKVEPAEGCGIKLRKSEVECPP